MFHVRAAVARARKQAPDPEAPNLQHEQAGDPKAASLRLEEVLVFGIGLHDVAFGKVEDRVSWTKVKTELVKMRK
jgi:hypothetical protein